MCVPFRSLHGPEFSQYVVNQGCKYSRSRTVGFPLHLLEQTVCHAHNYRSEKREYTIKEYQAIWAKAGYCNNGKGATAAHTLCLQTVSNSIFGPETTRCSVDEPSTDFITGFKIFLPRYNAVNGQMQYRPVAVAMATGIATPNHDLAMEAPFNVCNFTHYA
ncbi:hypothetical protein CBL_13308 [Carabus blaptoides fortunei]